MNETAMNETEYLKRIGEKVRTARMKRGLTMKQVSEVICMRRPNLNYIELGQRNVHIITLQKIADALSMDVKDFL